MGSYFLLLKKVINLVDASCKQFIWTGKLDEFKKTTVTWFKVCGGLNLKNLLVWSKVDILKLLWNLGKKKDCLWIRWMYCFYIMQNDLLSCPIPTTASWCVRKILIMGQHV